MRSFDQTEPSQPRRCAELLVDVLEVLAHGAGRDPQELGDLGVGLSPCQQIDDLGLTTGKQRSGLPLFEEQGAVDEVDDDGLLAPFDRQRLRARDPSPPEYPSGHSCFTAAITNALADFFGTDRVALTVDSTVTGTTHEFDRLRDVRNEVTGARIYGGLHFRKSMEDGEELGERTTRYVLRNNFDRARH